MIEAQKIACINDAGFVMSFVAQTNGVKSDSTGNYPIDQSRVIDLAATSFREGLEFWPVVDAVLGKTAAAEEHIIYKQNDQTATYRVTGTTLDYNIKLVGRPIESTLLDFPANIPLNRYTFKNWANAIQAPDLWTCAPRTAQDVVDVCNWAKAHGFCVRPRGIMHTWSPLTVTQQMSPDKVLLVDTTKNLYNMSFIPASDGQPPQVRVGAGATMGDLLEYLEKQPGSQGSAPGYSFPHTPGSGNLTVGGVLAINAHGTAVPTPPLDTMPSSYGSMSNHALEEWMLQRFTGGAGRVLPEWSKGWAYTSAGPWTNEQFMEAIRQSLSDGRDSNSTWNWEVATLQKYDRYGLFSNPFLSKLFVTI